MGNEEKKGERKRGVDLNWRENRKIAYFWKESERKRKGAGGTKRRGRDY